LCSTVSAHPSFSFSLIILPPPTSTLFPYTTLFRSVCALALPAPRRPRPVAIAWDADLVHRQAGRLGQAALSLPDRARPQADDGRSEEHTSELQSRENLVCRLLLEKKKHTHRMSNHS